MSRATRSPQEVLRATGRGEAPIRDRDEEWRIAESALERGQLRRKGLADEIDQIDTTGEKLAEAAGRELDARVNLDHCARM